MKRHLCFTDEDFCKRFKCIDISRQHVQHLKRLAPPFYNEDTERPQKRQHTIIQRQEEEEGRRLRPPSSPRQERLLMAEAETESMREEMAYCRAEVKVLKMYCSRRLNRNSPPKAMAPVDMGNDPPDMSQSSESTWHRSSVPNWVF